MLICDKINQYLWKTINNKNGVNMYVMGINGSSRENGNTAILINAVIREIKNIKIESELIQLAHIEIQPCKACFACKGKERCVYNGDGFNEVFQKMIKSDVIILGSPVYSADISAKMKAYIERAGVVVATNPSLLKFKIGASVCAVRRGGGLNAVDTLNHFFLNKEMIIVGSTYWNMGYGKDIGDVIRDEEGMRNMKNLGENIRFVLEKLQ